MVESGALGENFGMLRGREERNSHLIMWSNWQVYSKESEHGGQIDALDTS